MKNVSNYADLLVNVHNLLTFPSNSVELRIFNIYGNRSIKEGLCRSMDCTTGLCMRMTLTLERMQHYIESSYPVVKLIG